MASSLYSQQVVWNSHAQATVGPGWLVIDGGTITACGQGTRQQWQEAVAPDVERTDLGQRLIAPAFINAHTHLPMIAYRGVVRPTLLGGNVVEEVYFRIEGHLQPGDVKAFTRIGAYESLLTGVGCVWDHYYYGNEVALALVETGLSGVVAPTLQDIRGPGTGWREQQVEATVAIHEDSALKNAGIVAALGPHATDSVSSDLWQQVRDLANDLDLPIHVHVAQSIEEYERSVDEHGCSPILRLHREGSLEAGSGMFLVHGLFASNADIAVLEPSRHTLVYCPYSQVQFGFPAHIDSWREAGINLAVGTDCAACNDSMDVQQELRVLAWGASFATTHAEQLATFREQNSLDSARALWSERGSRHNVISPLAEPDTLLKTVWSTPGEAHKGLPLGRLAPGYGANIVIWDTEHPSFWPASDPLRVLTMSTVSGAIWGMMVQGKWIGTAGDYHRSLAQSPEYKEATSEARQRMQRLLERADLPTLLGG